MGFSRVACSLVAAAGLLGLISGCATTASGRTTHRATSVSAAVSTPVHRTDNRLCPLTGLPVNPGAPVANYRGYEVGFCMDGCVTVWSLLSDSERLSLVAKVLSGPGIDRRTVNGRSWRERSDGR